jgi:hypothetical protein
MPKRLKLDSIVVLVLAGAFHGGFMFAKHDPALSDIIPFGVDPYDAVGSFADIVGVLIALLSLVRAFWPDRAGPATVCRQLYLARTQAAVGLAVLIALVVDAVSMARHPAMWVPSPLHGELIALLGTTAAAAVAVEVLVCRAVRHINPTRARAPWLRAGIVCGIAVLILAVYPERLIDGLVTHLLTVVVGALVLFAPRPSLLRALIPYSEHDMEPHVAPAYAHARAARYRWAIVVAMGVLIGAALAAAELGEGAGSVPMGRVALVGSVFIALSVAGLTTAYAFLGKPLGLGPEGGG